MQPTGGDVGLKAGRREWIALAVLCLPTALTVLDLSVLILALPNLTADLGATATEQLWIVDIYGFVIAGFLVTMGTLGDRIGRKRLLLVGAAAFAVLSVVAAYSTSPEMLIVCRALLGIAGATIVPSTLALIMTLFRDPKQMGVAVAVWATALTGGIALGPVVGGVLLEWFWWGSVFLIAVPIMVVLLAFGPALLPDVRNPGAGRLDPLSVLLVLGAILPFVWGFKEIARTGWSTESVGAVVVGVAAGLVFTARQRKLADPLLDLRLFAIRAVSGALLLSLLVAAVQGGVGLYMAQYLQVVKGLTPLKTGLWILVPTVALILAIFVSQGIAQKVRPAYIVAVGMILAAIGQLLLTQVDATSGLGFLLLGFIVVYVGVAPVGPLVSQLVVPSAPPEKAGSAASLQSTSGELGVAFGIAALGSVGTAIYRSDLTLPAQVVGTPAGAAAEETVTGALQVAQTLPPGPAAALAESAQVAFTNGLNAAALICAVVFVGLAVVAIATLRHVPPMAAPGAQPPAPVGAGDAGTEPPDVEDTPRASAA